MTFMTGELRRLERTRTDLLFSISLLIGTFTYYELGRRQRLGEAREEKRREWVDGKLAELGDSALGHRERIAVRAGLVKGLYALAGLAVAAIPVIIYLAAK
jgi:hypothetical protein